MTTLPIPYQPIQRWTTATTATLEQYSQALTNLADAVPQWIGRMQQRRIHHAEPEARVRDNAILASILLMENEILRLRRKPNRNLSAILHAAPRQYPPDLQELVDHLIDLSDALFAPPDDRVITPCWFDHAVVPGSDSVLLQDIHTIWKEHYDRITQDADLIAPFYYDWPTAINQEALPPRVAVRHSHSSRQGWTGVSLQPEAAYDAIFKIAQVKHAGHRIMSQDAA